MTSQTASLNFRREIQFVGNLAGALHESPILLRQELVIREEEMPTSPKEYLEPCLLIAKLTRQDNHDEQSILSKINVAQVSVR